MSPAGILVCLFVFYLFISFVETFGEAVRFRQHKPGERRSCFCFGLLLFRHAGFLFRKGLIKIKLLNQKEGFVSYLNGAR